LRSFWTFSGLRVPPRFTTAKPTQAEKAEKLEEAEVIKSISPIA